MPRNGKLVHKLFTPISYVVERKEFHVRKSARRAPIHDMEARDASVSFGF